MTRSFTCSLIVLLCLLSGALGAQQCLYQFQLYDSYGDGWNGASITVHVNGEPTSYTFDFNTNDGDSLLVFIPVETGDSISIDFSSGSFPSEESYIILDNDDQLVFQDGPSPQNGTDIFNFIVTCATCVAPPVSTVEFSRLRSTSVDVEWASVPTLDDPTYVLEYGLQGYEQGVDFIARYETSDTTRRIQPLSDTTAYDVYLYILCPTDSMPDTSQVRGPLPVFTPLSIDVGVVSVTNPINGCQIGPQSIRLGIQNFGGQAQTLIPFDYSVNGQASGVNMPEDGLYVGIVGVDEVEFTEFDIQYDFSTPGSYDILVWTALDGDMDTSNDTISVTIVNSTFEQQLPYNESFEDDNGIMTVVRAGAGESSWEYGHPTGNVINNAASGQNAWVTNLDGEHNSNELSYLITPCISFADAEPDWIFSLDYHSVISSFDSGLYLETTTDGESWTRFGDSNSGVNWYNDNSNQWWDGISNGWTPALHPIGELAGEESVRFRFVFDSGLSTYEGFGIDNLYIGPRPEIDLAAGQVDIQAMAPCGSPEDLVTVTFYNLGLSNVDTIVLSYTVNGSDPVVEGIDTTLAPGETMSYTFMTPYDGTVNNISVIEVNTTTIGDGNQSNNIAFTTFEAVRDFPLFEDFENGEPSDWLIDSDVFLSQAHNAPSVVMYDNLWSADTIMRVTTANYGPVEAGDSLAFEYRFVDFGSPNPATVLGPDNALRIFIIENCDSIPIEIDLIDATNHSPTTDMTRRAYALDDFIGSDIQVLFEAKWASGDYYLDIDNVNLKRCPASFNLVAEVTDAMSNNSSDGSADISFQGGEGPYSFLWSNGDTTRHLTDVPSGDYSLTVTDAQGCSDQIDVRIDFMVSTEESIPAFGLITAAPNPTSGQLWIKAELLQREALQLAILDQFGRLIEQRTYEPQREIRDRFELGHLPAGLYFVRLAAKNQLRTIRVVKVN